MSASTVPNVVGGERTRTGVYLAGTFGAVAAAYHAGQTGTQFPLFGVCSVLALAVSFVTSEE